MKKYFNRLIRPVIQKTGFDIVRYNKQKPSRAYPPDFSADIIEICEIVKPYTMTSLERINALIHAVQYLEKRGIEGAFVECGVWKGGSAMAMAHALILMESETRDLYLYDTFSGMSAPTDVDISIRGAAAQQKFSETKISDDASNWCLSTIEEVKQNLFRTGYDKEKIHFINGKVEETIPKTIPREIALLRLDTDWFESTKHELIHLFPLLKKMVS